ncbi:hypothetical protein [Agromyces bauzanensis]
MRHPTAGPRSSVARWRAGLATMLVAGLALVGAAVGVAAPAAAEETPAPESTLEVEVTDCAEYGGQGSLHYVVRDIYALYRDFITVTDAADVVVHEATYLDGTEFMADVVLDPGEYTIIYTVERETGGRNIDEQAFTIGACPELDLSVTTSCSAGTDGTATVSLTGLVEREEYTYDVVGPDTSSFSDTFEAGGPNEEVVIGDLPPGNYYVSVDWLPDVSDLAAAPPPPISDWVAFAVEPCQPEISVEVTECAVPGGTASALVSLSNLVAGVEYEVSVTDRGDAGGTPYDGTRHVTADLNGTATISVSKLPADSEYTVWVDGLWTTTPWVEPPFVGGGGFTPLDEVALTAHADFDAEPCPVGLAATGVDGVAALVTGALVLLGLGGAALLIARRRRAGARDLS